MPLNNTLSFFRLQEISLKLKPAKASSNCERKICEKSRYKGLEQIRLTGMEFSVLELLVSSCGICFSRLEIIQRVLGYTTEQHVDTRLVDVYISRLRAKLEDDPNNPELILTIRGSGYMCPRIMPAPEA